jgi:hypothetical protein
LHGIALRANEGVQIRPIDFGMGLDSKKPHLHAASKAIWASRGFQKFQSGPSHRWTIVDTEIMSTITLYIAACTWLSNFIYLYLFAYLHASTDFWTTASFTNCKLTAPSKSLTNTVAIAN